MGRAAQITLAPVTFNAYSARCLQAPALLRLAFGCLTGGLLAGCAVQPQSNKTSASIPHRMNVRTTAYYSREDAGGRRNAVGEYLSGRIMRSAASDWSRFPLGTRFKIVGETEEYIIDDYGTALVGTNTIDLYKTSRLEMKEWGVRHVDIDILQWGSDEQSVKVLTPRAKHPCVRRMLLSLANKKKTPSARL